MINWNWLKNKCKGDKPTADCNCGCSDEARDSVRLTDAEIAQDIMGDITQLCDWYADLAESGCDCAEKLNSCVESKNELTEFVTKKSV